MQARQVKVVTSFAELEALRPFWEATQWHPGADYEFFRMIIQSRGNIISPCVLVMLEDEQPVALLAGRLERSQMKISLGYATLLQLPVRQLILIEGGFMGNRAAEVWEQFLKSLSGLFRQLDAKRLIVEQVKAGSAELQSVRRMFGRSRSSAMAGESEHWLMQMPRNWDDFLKSRSKKHRYWLKRLATTLDREFSGQWDIKIFTSEDKVGEFARAAELVASKTYQRGLGVGFRLQDEVIQRMRNEARRQQLRGYVLFIRGEPKAFWHCFAYGSTLYLASTGYDPAYRDYEIGTVLLMRVFQDHCGTKIENVDFGLGWAGYKQRFGSERYMESSICIFPKTLQGVALNGLQGAAVFSAGMAKRLFKRSQLAQRLKTFWRRKLESRIKAPSDTLAETSPNL